MMETNNDSLNTTSNLVEARISVMSRKRYLNLAEGAIGRSIGRLIRTTDAKVGMLLVAWW